MSALETLRTACECALQDQLTLAPFVRNTALCERLEAALAPRPAKQSVRTLTPREVEKLVAAAKRWAAFQDPASLEDQKTDHRLQAQAFDAREALLTIIEEELP